MGSTVETDTGVWRWIQTHGMTALAEAGAIDDGEAVLRWMQSENDIPIDPAAAQPIRLRPGEQYRFVLREAACLSWSATIENGAGVVRVTGERLGLPPDHPGWPGGVADRLFTVSALAPGTAAIDLALRPSGSRDGPSSRELRLRVEVEGLPAVGPAEAEDIGDGSPLTTQALEQCWEQSQRLTRSLGDANNAATASARRTRAETGVTVDANPYFGITQPKLEAVIRAAFTAAQPPEVLLALWAKEGSMRIVTAARPVPAATTPDRARALFRSSVYYVDLGADHFLVTTRTGSGADNIWDSRDAAAPAHEAHFAARVRELVAARLLPRDISAAINAELIVSASRPYTVLPTVKFYALSLLLVDALFTRMQRRAFAEVASLSPALNYLQWNMGTGRFREFLASADRHRREPRFMVHGEPISLEQWALRTRPLATEWRQARVNGIRFRHYVESFQPIFAAAMPLIKPGIEDLRVPGNVG